jgi:hypothetical protein
MSLEKTVMFDYALSAMRRLSAMVRSKKVLGGLLLSMLVWAGLLVSDARGADVDLSRAMIVVPSQLAKPEEKAIKMLVDEIEKRTLIRLATVHAWPSEDTAAIAIEPHAPGTESGVQGPEGYRIHVGKRGLVQVVSVGASDERGVLFGIGRLLRELHMSRGKILVSDDLNIATVPKYRIRGHQLGYRPKTNSYDGWDLRQWEQYFRDLAVFGTNAVELIPPRSDDAADSPHFPLPPMEMMVGMSKLADDYGLDVWVWYPALDRDYSNPDTVAFAINEWAEVFKKLPRLDAVFVPGGDPGHTQPKYLMALLEKQTASLHRYHPKAQMWVSPQGFTRQWMDEFLGILRNEQPAWLTGVVFGPQIRLSLPELREAVPKRYPIRQYPDITHSRQCQYPVPDWDLAYALTEGREVINPRPEGEAQIFRFCQHYAAGFISYSEGCNDDVNKIVWSCLGWDPNADVRDILRQYSRYFIGEPHGDSFARGLLALERNWRGPILTNDSIYTTLEQFRDMEKQAKPGVLLNWRFQQALYRAYYDAYVRRRLSYETDVQQQALDQLRKAKSMGSLSAMNLAEGILDRTASERVATDWRARVFELGEALFQSIRMQLSVERYKAISVDRGANLDTIDVPLNDAAWLKQRFVGVRRLEKEPERLQAIDRIAGWTDPGPGGFYDDLGSLNNHPHLLRGPGFEKDPDFRQSALVGFASFPGWRMSWCRHAGALWDAPVRMHYAELDPTVQYKLQVVYSGDSFITTIRLMANDSIEVHPYIKKARPVRPVEFDIPREATQRGELNLAWYPEPGRGGNGRGCQVSEVWLIKK